VPLVLSPPRGLAKPGVPRPQVRFAKVARPAVARPRLHDQPRTRRALTRVTVAGAAWDAGGGRSVWRAGWVCLGLSGLEVEDGVGQPFGLIGP
jgi:hypothetical protein